MHQEQGAEAWLVDIIAKDQIAFPTPQTGSLFYFAKLLDSWLWPGSSWYLTTWHHGPFGFSRRGCKVPTNHKRGQRGNDVIYRRPCSEVGSDGIWLPLSTETWLGSRIGVLQQLTSSEHSFASREKALSTTGTRQGCTVIRACVCELPLWQP